MAGSIDERQHLGHQRLVAIAGANRGQPLREHALVAEQVTERIVQQLDLRLVEAAALQADDVQPRQARAVANTLPNGITSASTPDTPPIIAARPIRTN